MDWKMIASISLGFAIGLYMGGVIADFLNQKVYEANIRLIAELKRKIELLEQAE